MTRQTHVLVVPFPAQGHVGPMMKMSHHLADRGIRVTFVVPESIRLRVLAAMRETDVMHNKVEFVSLPDGTQPDDDDDDKGKNVAILVNAMQCQLEDLIKKMNLSDNEKISCVLADVGWALESAEKLGIRKAMFWPTILPGLVLGIHIQKLIDDKVIDDKGFTLKNELIQISQSIPAMHTADFIWNHPGEPSKQELVFREIYSLSKAASISNWLICNSFYEIDPLVGDHIPNLLQIGPLRLGCNNGRPAANFWPEDSTCFAWLNKQSPISVIYAAFGSSIRMDQHQFEELALGLELTARPFLWVVRPDLIAGSSRKCYKALLERLSIQGKIVDWAPQEKVLAHPSIACFITHCGWNSTVEGLCFGVPFLCWPYACDQFLVKRYICNVWKVGLGLLTENNETVSRHRVRDRIEELLLNNDIRVNSMKIRDMAAESVREGGSASDNFSTFVQQLNDV